MATSDHASLRPLIWVLVLVVVLGGVVTWQSAEGFSLLGAGHDAPATAAGSTVPTPRVDDFDAPGAMRWARRQVALGPRPAGSPAQRAAAAFLAPALPGGHLVALGPAYPGLRNIEGRLPGGGRAILLIAHYDTTPVAGYVGANNSAAAVGAVIELARALARDQHPTDRPIRFLLTDGEEAPTYPVDGDFVDQGLRGSRVAAQTMRPGEAIVLDFVGQRDLRIPRERSSTPALWDRLRAAARRVGVASVFPDATQGTISDDHTPFLSRGIPAIDLIDFDYPCWQRPCDTMDQLSTRSVDAAGEAVLALVRRLRR
jgi:glutaminyl-peptide cyclotransferase